MELDKLNKKIKELKKGDSKAFDGVYDLTNKIIFSVAFSYLKDSSLALDVVQETYLVVLNKIGTYDEEKSSLNWIITIAKNITINLLNRRKKEVSVDFEDNEWKYSELQGEQQYKTPIMEVMKKVLNEEEIEIVSMCLISGFKRKEVASYYDVPLSIITWKYNNAINKIKEQINKEGGL